MNYFISILIYPFIAFSFFAYSSCPEVFEKSQSKKRQWRDVHLAGAYAQSQGIQTRRQFERWSKSGKRPPDIPADPATVYGRMGQWTDWGTFLGTGTISNNKREWRDYHLAESYVRTLGFTGRRKFKEWSDAGLRPPDIPASPAQVYGRMGQWTDWKTFLGAENMISKKREWRDFRLAGAYIRSQGITTSTQFEEWSSAGLRPPDIPASPAQVYGRMGQWKGWPDFLDTKNIKRNQREWRDYHLTEAYVRTLGFTGRRKFKEWSDAGLRPPDIPANPDRVYTRLGQWTNWGAFLGTGNISNSEKREWRDYRLAEAYVRPLGFTGRRQFEKWPGRPPDIPATPDKVYARLGQWKGWNAFLGKKTPIKTYRDFDLAKTYVRALGFQARKYYKEWAQSDKRPPDIPAHPDQVYKKTGHWKGWRDFLGIEWRDYRLAGDYALAQGVKSEGQFRKWSDAGLRPPDIPVNPVGVYTRLGQWKGWGDFLKTGNTSPNKQEWRDYRLAEAYVRALGFTGRRQFEKWPGRPPDIPATPDKVYARLGQWTDWGTFLGTGNIGNSKREWRDYRLAGDYAWSQGVTSGLQFKNWPDRPPDIPANPQETYAKLGQWKGWGDFLKTGNTSNNKREWRDIHLASAYVRSQGITTEMQFNEWSQSGLRPPDIPSNPQETYRRMGQWKGWKIFLGTHKWMNFPTARRYARKLEFANTKDFIEWLKSDQRPKNFPPEPHKYYPEWISATDFLGIQWMPFRQFKQHLRQFGIESKDDFFEYILSEKELIPENFPTNPSTVYKQWRGWDNLFRKPKLSLSRINGHSLDNEKLQPLTTDRHESSSLKKNRSDLEELEEDVSQDIGFDEKFGIDELPLDQDMEIHELR